VLKIVRQNLQHHIDLFGAHGLNDVLSIMAKEEKAATLASAFTGVEDLLAVQHRI